jgi:formate hydrogenlyase subunit 3/multisubunit Na+/H+ antiporter MnhD subunit
MDLLGTLFLCIILIIYALSYFLFANQLKKYNKTEFKYKLNFLLMCVFSIIAIVIFCYFFQTYILFDLFEIEINHAMDTDRIITLFMIIIPFGFGNIILSKMYLKKILSRRNINKNEIEFIGKKE